MGMFDAFDVSASGLTAQRMRMDVIAEKVSFCNSTFTIDALIILNKILNIMYIFFFMLTSL